MQRSLDNIPLEVVIACLAKRLEDHFALSQKAACWAVESWALALGVMSEKQIQTAEIRTEAMLKVYSEYCFIKGGNRIPQWYNKFQRLGIKKIPE